MNEQILEDKLHQAMLHIRDLLNGMNKNDIRWFLEREDAADFFEEIVGISAQAVNEITDNEILESI